MGLRDRLAVRHHPRLYLLCCPEFTTACDPSDFQWIHGQVDGPQTEVAKSLHPASGLADLCDEAARLPYVFVAYHYGIAETQFSLEPSPLSRTRFANSSISPLWQHNPIRFLIIDFALVYGLDFSSAEAFVRIQRILAAKDVLLILCGAKSEGLVGTALRSVDLWSGRDEHRVEVFEALNDALEWTENAYL